MKRIMITILLAALMVAAVAVAEDALLNAAWALAPQNARLVGEEAEDGLREYDFTTEGARCEVTLSRDGEPVAVETEYTGVGAGSEALLDQASAEAVALADAGEGAWADLSLLEKEGRRYVWTVFLLQGGNVLEYEINAATGAVKSMEVFYGAAANPPSALAEKLRQEKGELTLTEAELELEDGTLVFSGEAQKSGKRYEYALRVLDGKVLEWDRD